MISMKQKITAVFLSFCIAFSCTPNTFADFQTSQENSYQSASESTFGSSKDNENVNFEFLQKNREKVQSTTSSSTKFDVNLSKNNSLQTSSANASGNPSGTCGDNVTWELER